MPRSSGSRGLQQRPSDQVAGDRRGLLQSDEQRPPVPVEFLLAFVRALIRNHPSTDAMYLALAAASRQVPISKKQGEAFIEAVTQEMESSVWPKGFF